MADSELEIEIVDEYKDTFAARIIEKYIKKNFLNSIKTLFSPRIRFFTISLILGLGSLGVFFFIPYFNNLIYQILVLVFFSIMAGMLITGVISYKVFVLWQRILIFSLLAAGTFILLYFTNWLPYIYIINEFLIYGYLIMLSIGMFLIIKNFHQTWLAKISMIGKTKNDVAYKKLLIILLLGNVASSSVFIYFFMVQQNILHIIAFVTSLACTISLTSIFKKSIYEKHESFEYFSLTMVFYFSFSMIFIFTLMFVSFFLQNLFFIGLIMMISVLGTVQVIKPPDLFQKRLFKKQKIRKIKQILREQRERIRKARSIRDDDDVIIINVEDDSDKEKIELPKTTDKMRDFGRVKEKVGPKREALIIIFLGFLMSIFSLIVFRLNSVLNLPLIYPFTLNITWFTFNEYLIYSIYAITLILVITYFVSSKNKRWYANETSMKNAFLQFLSQIEKGERSVLLREMADTVREILISGIIDMFDPDSDSKAVIGDTIKDGISFVKRLFTGRDED